MSRDYSAFDAQDYLERYFNFDQGAAPTAKAWLETIARFYKSAALPPESARILEFGGGPHVVPLISAVPFAKEILFAEFLEVNRDVVLKWRDGEVEFPSVFREVVERIEDQAPDNFEARAASLRDKLTEIIPCDITNEDPLLGAAQGPFDVISTHLCLEAACLSKAAYLQSVVKLANLLKRPGGKMIASIGVECSFYTVGDSRFLVTPLTLEDIREGFTLAGFDKVELTCVHFPQSTAGTEAKPKLSDIKGRCIVFASF
ncbi:hypothetical protein BSKO_10289 [Bryopsis sp. KO-2023]|nr:hypothetical protein BSKO_10289 [Bryopsis sp. KO-2023]